METNKINHKNEVVPGVTLEELIALKEEFLPGKKKGEFTITDFAEANGIAYHTAKGLMKKAVEGNKVGVRAIGKRNYYRFIKEQE